MVGFPHYLSQLLAARKNVEKETNIKWKLMNEWLIFQVIWKQSSYQMHLGAWWLVLCIFRNWSERRLFNIISTQRIKYLQFFRPYVVFERVPENVGIIPTLYHLKNNDMFDKLRTFYSLCRYCILSCMFTFTHSHIKFQHNCCSLLNNGFIWQWRYSYCPRDIV